MLVVISIVQLEVDFNFRHLLFCPIGKVMRGAVGLVGIGGC